MTENKMNIINCIKDVLLEPHYNKGKHICISMDQLKRIVDYIFELAETDD